MTSEEEVVEALSRPSLYAHAPDRVDHFQTHLSHVFVAPPFAYKLKKAVRFSFADFSSPATRLATCLDEVSLNRRLCAPLYLGVLALRRGPDGAVVLDPEPLPTTDAAAHAADGETVEPVVWMRALPSDGMGHAAIARARIDAAILATFANSLARFHAAIAPEPEDIATGWLEDLERRWLHVLDDSRGMIGRALSAIDHEILADFGPSFVRRHASLLEARVRAGRVREGHGDLHLGNLCLVEQTLPAIDGAPEVPPALYAFDCVEFSRDLRVNDVASEVAFLAMDLEAAGRPDLARSFVHDYATAARDDDLVAVLPFFVSHRAAIRGMVRGLAADQPEIETAARTAAATEARDHFALATRHAWRAAGPTLIAFAGLSGSGKTTLAIAVAEASGFHLLSSDELRKRRAGLDPKRPIRGEESTALYTEAARHAVYVALAAEAASHLTAGACVIVDATFHRAAERAELETVARRTGCPLLFVECRSDDDTARARLATRAAAGGAEGDAPAVSDADARVRAMQREALDAFRPDEPHLVVDTAGDRAGAIDRALRLLWRWRREHATRVAPGAIADP